MRLRCMHFVLMFAGSVYLVMAALPITALWYDPGRLVISDTVQGVSPQIEFARTIKRPTIITFNVSVRRTGNLDDVPLACDQGNGGGFEYQPATGVLAGKDLAWWMNTKDCISLPPGRYWVQTCWRAEQPARALLPHPLKDLLGWLLPPKSICKPAASEWGGGGYTFEIRAD